MARRRDTILRLWSVIGDTWISFAWAPAHLGGRRSATTCKSIGSKPKRIDAVTADSRDSGDPGVTATNLGNACYGGTVRGAP